jgi:anti-sigma factor RsiW
MECKQARPFIDAYIDDELAANDKEDVARHLSGCADCTSIHEQLLTLREDVLANGRHKAPSGLRERVKSVLENEAYTHLRGGRRRSSRFTYTTAALAAGLILGLFAGPMVSEALLGRPYLSQDILAAHIRSQMVNHLTDVTSSDSHTVKPWFKGKLNFSPPVYDYTSEGFTLIGARIDYLSDRPVAALIYQRQRHVINLFVWPDSESRLTPVETRQGFNILNWGSGDLTFWAISDLNKVELQELRQLFLSNASH